MSFARRRQSSHVVAAVLRCVLLVGVPSAAPHIASAEFITVMPGSNFVGNTDRYVYDPVNANVNAVAVGDVGAVTLDGTMYIYAPWGTSGGTFVTDFLGRLQYIIDEVGRLVKLGQFTESLRTISDPLGNTTRFHYDTQDRVSRVEDSAGNSTQYHYDATDRVIQTIDPTGNVVQYQYDAGNNRLQSINEPLGVTTTYTYDSNQYVASSTNTAGVVTQYTYDSNLRLDQVSDPGGTTQYTYDSTGNLSTIIDPLGATTTYQYDSLNRLSQVTEPVAQVTQYIYDTGDNLIQTIDPLGVITQYTYDSAFRLVQLEVDGGRVTRYSYDTLGRLTSINDSEFGVSAVEHVPEPSSLLLACLGAIGVGAFRRTRRGRMATASLP